MKLFSRKALVSVATATALTAGSLSAPAFAQGTTPTETTQGSANVGSSTATGTDAEATSNTSSDLLEGSSDPETGKLDTKQIAAWISLVGTVISVLTAAVTFAAKIGALTK
ncbi:hypothetical protein [Corynebacterium vitaeruminis]|uniref:hypothetical protein n=1 Tax=Corynebacterium vitaeruminis TaxID=38305 RepID=UPI0023F9B8C7|nr:hypothetical protein [Corynebacterium vitaeruminis]